MRRAGNKDRPTVGVLDGCERNTTVSAQEEHTKELLRLRKTTTQKRSIICGRSVGGENWWDVLMKMPAAARKGVAFC